MSPIEVILYTERHTSATGSFSYPVGAKCRPRVLRETHLVGWYSRDGNHICAR